MADLLLRPLPGERHADPTITGRVDPVHVVELGGNVRLFRVLLVRLVPSILGDALRPSGTANKDKASAVVRVGVSKIYGDRIRSVLS